jgi:phosphate transport system ATP-binding protein
MSEPISSFAGGPVLAVRDLRVMAGERTLLRDIRFDVPAKSVVGVIGPSGAGKTTLLKSLNRLLDLNPRFRVTGEVLLDGRSIYAPGVDADAVRVRIGMLFQQPVVFPKSIYDNVTLAVKHLGQVPRKEWPAVAERALREAALWDEVKDRLKESALRLSVGQQQRLCLARTLASQPEVILMDEPTSALDPRSSEAIEELVVRLKSVHAIVIVTHHFAQARRVADSVVSLAAVEGVGCVRAWGPAAQVLDEAENAGR